MHERLCDAHLVDADVAWVEERLGHHESLIGQWNDLLLILVVRIVRLSLLGRLHRRQVELLRSAEKKTSSSRENLNQLRASPVRVLRCPPLRATLVRNQL